MISKLERYNKIRELLIENGTTGLWGHIHYQDGGWSASVNYDGCPHWEEGDGDVNRTQGHIQLVSESGMGAGMHTTTVEQSRSINKMEIAGKERGLEPSGPRSTDEVCGQSLIRVACRAWAGRNALNMG